MAWHSPRDSWRSGRWTLELRDDELADIAFGGRVALRSIRAVVRDRNWATAELIVDDIESDADSLRLSVHADGLGAGLAGTLRVDAAASTLTVSLNLTARHTFLTNRTGLVALHPSAAAGAPLRVQHVDGSTQSAHFPSAISPHQPVLDIAELAWRSGGLAVDVRFGGEAFEMEDQRNWTDASFKTYSRPLALPFPYELAAGTHVHQQIEVQVRSVGHPESRNATVIDLRADGAFPQIVLGAATAPDPAPHADPIGCAVMVELDLATPNWRAALGRAARSGLPLDVRFILAKGDQDAVRTAARSLQGLPVARVGAFAPAGASAHVSDAQSVTMLANALAEAKVVAQIVGGVRSHFTELNRERHRLPSDLDGIVFSVTPLFHSLGTEQLVESVAMQRLVAGQAVEYAAGSPVHIGPVTLRPRFNNVATTPPPMPEHSDLSGGYGSQLIGSNDSRQDAVELAAWTIASAAALAVPGVASLAYFEEWGPRGIRRSDGSDRPVAAAIRALAELHGTTLLHGTSPDGLIWAVGGRLAEDGASVLMANLDTVDRAVVVHAADESTTVILGPGRWSKRP